MNNKEIKNIIKKVYPFIKETYNTNCKVELHTNIYERLSGISGMNGEYSPHGEYDWNSNKIYLYTNRMTSQEQIIKTLIHETVHSTQSKVLFDLYYQLGETYLTHPFEIEAREYEETWKNYKLNTINVG